MATQTIPVDVELTPMMDYGKFKNYCENLALSDDTVSRAWSMLTELVDQNKSEILKESVQLEGWVACVLYIIVSDVRNKLKSEASSTGIGSEQAVTVCDILTKTDTPVVELFQRLKVIRELREMSPAFEEDVISLERKYCIACPLFNKFEKMFEDIFLSSADRAEKYKLCWTLFTYIKAKHTPEHIELVATFHMLVGCFIYIMRRTPSFQLKPPYNELSSEPDGIDYSKALCEAYCASVDDVSDMTNFIEEHMTELAGELENTAIEKLTELYLAEHKKRGDINELLFMEHHKTVVAPTASSKSFAPEKVDSQPVNQTPPETPVSSALYTVHNLKNLLHTTPDGPSTKLIGYFQNCSVDPASDVSERLASLKEVFVRRFIAVTNHNQRQLGQQRYQLSVRLYFRVLEALLITEEERLSIQDFSQLLNNATFHTCLLACAVEVVLFTYNHIWMPAGPSMMAFPWILNVFEVHGYDFYKVLESFIRAEPELTREVVRHLQEVETKILESMAWQSGSPLYEVLNRTESVRLHMPPPSPRAAQHGSPGLENSSAAQLYLSPVRRIPIAEVPCISTPGTMDPPQSPVPKRKSQSLNLFYNKVSRLAFCRLQTLCGFLGIPSDLQINIWTCVQHVITQKADLMRDRHLDQIVLCSIYAICKVKEREMKFKAILSMYKNLPHSSPQVYKNTLIAENHYDSIIGFYNQIFMHNLKSYILRFSSPRQTPSMSPIPVTSPLTKSPVYKLPGWKNFFVSPLKSSPFKCPLSPNQMTPRSRQLYSFGEGLRGETGSAEKLKAINDSMRAAKHTLDNPMVSPRSQPRSQKCLKFDISPGQQVNETSPSGSAFLPVKRVARSKVALNFEEPTHNGNANQENQ